MASPAFADSFWINASGSNDFNAAGSWNGGAPSWGVNAWMTNGPSASTTNIAYLNAGNGGFSTLVISNRDGAAGGINMVLVNSTFLQGDYVRLGQNGMITVNGGSMTWWRGGTLGAGGTIILNSSSFNYGGEVEANFQFAGTLIGNSGTWAGTASGGDDAIRILSGGRLVANSGTFYVNPNDAWDYDGMTIESGGTLQVNSGATFVLNRAANAWNNDSNPDNAGTIFLNGGTITMAYDGSQASDRGIQNSGTILGSGTLAMRVAQSSSGQTIASNGTLNIFQTVAGNQQTFTSDGGAFGTFKAVSGGTLKINGNVASGMGGAWLVDSGGTIEIAASSVDLGAAYMQGANFAGTVKVNPGNTLTFSSAAGGSALLSQSGTFEFVATNNGPVSMNMPGVGGLNTFTNNGVFLLSGTGTGRAGWTAGVAGASYAFINNGKIDLRSGGTLTINTIDATTTGFSNTSAGIIVITNGSTFRIDRSATGWGGDTPVNAGTMILSNGTFQTVQAGSTNQGKLFRNAGTILVQGAANVTNYWQATMQNAGTILITNNNAALQLGTASTVNWFTNTAAGRIVLGTNGASASLIATNGPDPNRFSNLGTIEGQGTLTLGRNNADGGQNANFVNSGTLIATNWGGASAGTLFISTGNAWANGGFSNTTVGTILIASNMTLTINRSQNAWAGSSNSIANLGTITLVGGTLNLASDGIVSNAASFINSGTISGWGTIDSVVITTNGGKVYANATNLTTGVGTLTLRVASTTNNSTATLGTLGTNAVLNLIMPGSQNVLINFGTISVSGGTINFSGVAGTITNFYVVGGVGNLSSFDIVSTGATASIVAQNPIPGLSNLVAGVLVTNSSILGASSNATLVLETSTGQGLVNNGTVFFSGGRVTVTNAAGADAGITNLTGMIYGTGTQTLRIANLSGGTIMASNGVLSIGADNNLNQGTLTNLNAFSTIQLTNSILVNQGKIFLSGGGLRLTGSVISNGTGSTGTITGPGDISSSLYNDTLGWVMATNGTLNVATNAGEFVTNLGTFDVAGGTAPGTLNIVPDWNNTNGTVRMAGGTLSGGTVTNKGTISGNGTVMSSVVNTSEGTIRATNGVLVLRQTAITQSGTMIGGTASGTYIQITNVAGFVINNGTMILDSPSGGATNLAFYILQDFSNAPNALVMGAGILRTADNVIGGSDANFGLRNMGNILATNGTLIVDSGDGFSAGFNNGAGATVTVANASTFGIARSTNAWLNSNTNPVNNGVIILNGGTLRSFTNVSTGTAATPVAIASSSTIYGIISNSTTGVISGFGTIGNNLINNLGTINATNGTLVIAGTAPLTNNVVGVISIQNGATLTSLQSSGSLQNNGTIFMNGGTLVATGMTTFVISQTGSITGFGTINTGTASGSGGDNARIINSGGTIVATNGTLFVNPGDAFSQGGFSNSASARITIASGASFVLNRTSHAWNNDSTATNVANVGTITLAGGSWSNYAEGVADSSRYVRNAGTIIGNGIFFGSLTNLGTIGATNGMLTVDGSSKFRQAGTLSIDAGGTLRLTNSTGSQAISFTNEASILMRGGELQAGVIANTNVIFGFGTISGSGVDNGATGSLLASNGTLVATLQSSVNLSNATLGTLSTNAILDLTFATGGNSLLNSGTVRMAGGTIQLGGISGAISNFGTIMGVGNLTNTIVNSGTIMAAYPVSGLSMFSVGMSDLNMATIGASNGAILNVVISGGPSFNNNGSITMLGGQLIISGATGVITNNAFVSGSGSITPAIVNSSNIVASVNGGTLQVTLFGGTNLALGNLRAGLGGVLVLSNNAVVSLGTIGASGANGGTITVLNSGVITNRGTGVISGDSSTGGSGLSINSFVYNEAGGTIIATNGVLRFNDINGLFNSNATILVSQTGTFQSNSSNSWANAGSIDMRGGTLRTGGFTNAAAAAIFTNTGSGQIIGYGTIVGGGAYGAASGTAGFDKSIVNLGTIIATNPLSSTAQTLYITTGGATSQNGIDNLGTMIVSSNNTLSLNRDAGLAILNRGTITVQNGTLTGSGILSNDLNGIIEGYGTLSHPIVNASQGTIRATNGIMVMTSSVEPANQGTFQIENGATMQWNSEGSWINNGTIAMRGGTLRTGGITNTPPPAGPFPGEPFTNANYIAGWGTVHGGGAYGGNGSGYDKSIVNLGTITASNGTLVVETGVATANRGLANLGYMIVSTTNDTLELRRTAEFGVGFTNLNYIYNSGTILIHGGTLTSITSITNAYEGPTLPGLIQGFGVINLTNQLVNLGTIRSTNTVAGGNGILYFNNPQGGALLDVKQNGTLAVEASSQMIFGTGTNATFANNGTILMNGGILRAGAMTNNLLITGRGTIDAGLAVNTGTVVSASGALQFLNPSSGGGLSLQQNGTLVVQSSSQMIFGTASNAPIANAGTILMQGGNLYAGVLTNLNGARITGYGTMTSSIFNSGTILANSPSTPLHLLGANVFNQTNGFLGVSSGRLIVDSVFTNAGTVSILNSLGTFNSDVVNRGAWISDPSTTTFAGNFTVETNGYISMTAGDVMVFTNGASFINTSTMSNLYDTLNGKFIFEGGGGLTQAFYVAGIDNLGTNLIANGTLSQTNSFGPAPFTTDIIGYSNNFALGTLQVGTLSLTSTVSLIDSFLTVGPDDGHKAGLYVMNLTINPGSLLIISNNVELYFQTTNGITGVSFDTLTPGDNVLILGNGSFHQLEIIPEPSILMLLVIGGLGIYWRRRHRRA